MLECTPWNARPPKTQTVESDSFDIKIRVRQGDVLSPLLLTIFMDKCIRDIIDGRKRGAETLAYADDVALVIDSAEVMQEIAARWHDVMSQNEMKINTAAGKAEFTHLSRRDGIFDIVMGQENLRQIDEYNYLGTHMNSKNIQEAETDKKIAKFNGNVGVLYPLLTGKYVPTECRITMYNIILKPILMYGSKVWSLTSRTKSKLQAAEMRVLKLIRGVTRLDRLRNTRVQEDLQVEPLLDSIEKGKLRWYGHVMRMEEQKIPKRYLSGHPHAGGPWKAKNEMAEEC